MSIESLYKTEITLFREHVKSLRKAKGLTQNQLRDVSGITQSQISVLEKTGVSPNPSFDTLVRLSHGFKIEMKFLFLYKTKEPIPAIKKTFKTTNERSEIERGKFGIRIEKICLHRNLIQEELAVLAKIDPSDLSRYISGEVNIEFFSILKIATALEIKIFDLFDYNGLMPDNKYFKGKT